MTEAKKDLVVLQGSAITPMDMLKMAVSQNADLDKMEKLMQLQERWEANEARKAFNKALGKFKSESIAVGKDALVSYKTDKGVTSYKHATLGNICAVLNPALSAHGLSFRWETERDSDRIKVTCILSHEMGHSASVTLDGAPDTSGGKNNIQATGSTVSYLQRYTLLAITGTATEEQDDDGRGGAGGDADGNNGGAGDKGDKKDALPRCADAKFAELCADILDESDPGKIKTMGWKSLVTSGSKPVERLISMLQTKYEFTEEQLAEMRGWAVKKGSAK
jgi:hypothetical protein